jgi:steroid 5-alpha reductase family enzyme
LIATVVLALALLILWTVVVVWKRKNGMADMVFGDLTTALAVSNAVTETVGEKRKVMKESAIKKEMRMRKGGIAMVWQQGEPDTPQVEQYELLAKTAYDGPRGSSGHD